MLLLSSRFAILGVNGGLLMMLLMSYDIMGIVCHDDDVDVFASRRFPAPPAGPCFFCFLTVVFRLRVYCVSYRMVSTCWSPPYYHQHSRSDITIIGENNPLKRSQHHVVRTRTAETGRGDRPQSIHSSDYSCVATNGHVSKRCYHATLFRL